MYQLSLYFISSSGSDLRLYCLYLNFYPSYLSTHIIQIPTQPFTVEFFLFSPSSLIFDKLDAVLTLLLSNCTIHSRAIAEYFLSPPWVGTSWDSGFAQWQLSIVVKQDRHNRAWGKLCQIYKITWRQNNMTVEIRRDENKVNTHVTPSVSELNSPRPFRPITHQPRKVLRSNTIDGWRVISWNCPTFPGSKRCKHLSSLVQAGSFAASVERLLPGPNVLILNVRIDLHGSKRLTQSGYQLLKVQNKF